MPRPTSSAQNPVPGLPLSAGVAGRRNHRLVYRDADPKELAQKPFDAEVKLIKHCALGEYDGGRGLRDHWALVKGAKNDDASLHCKGDHTKMVMKLRRFKVFQDPNPEVFSVIELPNDLYRVSLKLFETGRRIQIGTVSKSGKDGKDECWDIVFDDEDLRSAKILLRRLANHCGEMPGDWFTYRNFWPQALGVADRSRSHEDPPGAHTVYIPGGHVWRFTGFFAHASNREIGDVPFDRPTQGQKHALEVEGMVKCQRAKREGIIVNNIPLDPPMWEKRARKLTRRYNKRHPEETVVEPKSKGKASLGTHREPEQAVSALEASSSPAEDESEEHEPAAAVAGKASSSSDVEAKRKPIVGGEGLMSKSQSFVVRIPKSSEKRAAVAGKKHMHKTLGMKEAESAAKTQSRSLPESSPEPVRKLNKIIVDRGAGQKTEFLMQ